MIKLLAIDLDNTLLRNDKTISTYTAEVLAKCREKGIKLAFATARPLRTIKGYMEQTNCDAVIYHNGAHIIVGETRIGEPQIIPIASAKAVLGALAQRYPGKRLSVEIDDVLYANFDAAAVWTYTEFVFTDFSDLPDKGADKVLIESGPGVEHEFIAGFLTPEIYCQLSEGQIYLIMHRNARKLSALETLAAHFGIGLEETAAFGDDRVDIDMIKACGLGVAVGNASKEVIEAADAVTDTNENDGVAKYIEENIL